MEEIDRGVSTPEMNRKNESPSSNGEPPAKRRRKPDGNEIYLYYKCVSSRWKTFSAKTIMRITNTLSIAAEEDDLAGAGSPSDSFDDEELSNDEMVLDLNLSQRDLNRLEDQHVNLIPQYSPSPEGEDDGYTSSPDQFASHANFASAGCAYISSDIDDEHGRDLSHTFSQQTTRRYQECSGFRGLFILTFN